MNHDELEKLLDDALASYTLREPRAGFNSRIMARVRAQRAAPRWTWLHFAAALALGAVALIAALWRTPAARPVAVQQQIARVPDAPVVRTAEHPRVSPRRAQRDEMTPDQRALVAFARLDPDAAQRLAQPCKPLQIEPIQVRPLQIDDIEIGEIE